MATAFVIEKDGTIYQAFDPAAWAWQFGLSWRDDQRIPFEQRFIGIEIGNYVGEQFRGAKRDCLPCSHRAKCLRHPEKTAAQRRCDT